MKQTLTNLQVTEVVVKASKLMRENKDLRMGQALMNALHEVSPAFTYDIQTNANKAVDPFYNDAYIPNFWAFLT